MSVAALNWVWEESSASTSTEVAVLAGMADWADPYGYCYPSYPAIARRARVSERQVKRIIAKFVGLGEIERNSRGHRVSAPGHRPGKTGLQPRNYYRFARIPDEPCSTRSSDTMSPLSTAKAVTPATASGDTSDSKAVTSRASHIRKNRQIDPSGDPSERAAAVPRPLSSQANEPPDVPEAGSALTDPLEAFRETWNSTTTLPIPRCESLTRRRRRLIRACLVERPIAQWRALFARIERSHHCRGENRDRWVATFDWIISSPDAAAKVLEGHYDNRYSSAELDGARRFRAQRMCGICPHEPMCLYDEDCLERIARALRAERRARAS